MAACEAVRAAAEAKLSGAPESSGAAGGAAAAAASGPSQDATDAAASHKELEQKLEQTLRAKQMLEVKV